MVEDDWTYLFVDCFMRSVLGARCKRQALVVVRSGLLPCMLPLVLFTSRFNAEVSWFGERAVDHDDSVH